MRVHPSPTRVLWGQSYGFQYLVKNAWVLQNWHRFRGCTLNPTPLHEFAQFLGCDPPPRQHTHPAKTCLSAWVYLGTGYVMHFLTPQPCLLTCIPFTHFSLGPSLNKLGVTPLPHHSGSGPAYDLIFIVAVTQWHLMGAEQIVEKSWPNRKETLKISIKLQPNVIHSQLGVINVRNRISRLQELCIIKPIWRIKQFVDQQTINVEPRLAVNMVMADKATHALHSLHVFRCTHVEGFKRY